jgi:hypothetical protein
MQNDIGRLAQAPEHFTARQRGADRVAIGARVGRQHKTIPSLDMFEYFLQHGPYTQRADRFFFFDRVNNSSILAWYS